MTTDEEFRSLGLTKPQTSLAWEARAKIIWGDKTDDVRTWLVGCGINDFMADQIVAFAVSERAGTMRKNGMRDLCIGIPVGLAGAAVGVGAVLAVKQFNIPFRGPAVVGAFATLALMYGVNLTWRGLERIIGGSRTAGAASDVED